MPLRLRTPPQVWGGYDILMAHNTLVRVGCGTPAQDLYRAAIDVLYCERGCAGERDTGSCCNACQTLHCSSMRSLASTCTAGCL